ncbi:peptide deformylase [Plantibacter sp. YIM 135249]|uniref:peptide deformylase n=1 Tax=Plantibacter sp. YIM 135249 TaxID=3423918 RepID=UPI003D32545A
MALLEIRVTGDPVLHAVAQPVTVVDDELRQLVSDMYETMDRAPGVGLAAPQVGVSLRLFVYSYEDDEGLPWRGVAINPVLWISPSDTAELDEEDEAEGCLSVPGERFPLRRAESALLIATDLDGEPVELQVDGWRARILQHEFDHLNGVLYVDRLTMPYSRRAEKAVKKSGWGVPGISWLPGRDDLEG